MKRNVLSILILTVVTLILNGCGGSNEINMVKNSTLELDQSLTIGNAFDHYKGFSNTQWEVLQTERKQTVVQFKGYYKDILIKQYTFNVPDGTYSGKGEDITVIFEKPFYLCQFILSPDGQSFSVGYCEIGGMKRKSNQEEWIYNDSRRNYKYLKMIYKNKVISEYYWKDIACTAHVDSHRLK